MNKQRLSYLKAREKSILAKGKYLDSSGVLNKVQRKIKKLESN